MKARWLSKAAYGKKLGSAVSQGEAALFEYRIMALEVLSWL